jgi:hypothetical protein
VLDELRTDGAEVRAVADHDDGKTEGVRNDPPAPVIPHEVMLAGLPDHDVKGLAAEYAQALKKEGVDTGRGIDGENLSRARFPRT